jgi:hypothetical protein
MSGMKEEEGRVGGKYPCSNRQSSWGLGRQSGSRLSSGLFSTPHGPVARQSGVPAGIQLHNFSCTISVFALHQRRARSKGRSHCRARSRPCRQFRNPVITRWTGPGNQVPDSHLDCSPHPMDRSPVKAAFPLAFSFTISVLALHQRRARSKGRSHCRARCRSCRQFRNPVITRWTGPKKVGVTLYYQQANSS